MENAGFEDEFQNALLSELDDEDGSSDASDEPEESGDGDGEGE